LHDSLKKDTIKENWMNFLCKNFGAKTIFALLGIFLLFTQPIKTGAFVELLTNTGFEGSYDSSAPGWSDHPYGTIAYTFSKETTLIHGGTSAQKINVVSVGTDGQGVYSLQNLSFVPGRTYEGSIWLYAPTPMVVSVVFKRGEANYDASPSRTLQIGPVWQKVTIQGGFSDNSNTGDGKLLQSVPGFFGVLLKTPGTIIMDDASLQDISTLVANATPPQNTIPASFFGMHVNKLNILLPLEQTTWPKNANFGLLRLVDTGTLWSLLEPSKGVWDWSRMDYYVNAAVTNRKEVMYSFGFTPVWAFTGTCSLVSPNTSMYGCKEPPSNIQDWEDYVRAVGTRYKGKIKYWEIWNEVDWGGFYNGTADQLIQMTQIAHDVLKSIDSSNIILSPNFTVPQGLFDEFLFKGGGAYSISVHKYFTLLPEFDTPVTVAFLDIMRANGVGHLPLWDTETNLDPHLIPKSDAEAQGILARMYLTLWANGISNMSWYAWDIIGPYESISLSASDYSTLTPAGVTQNQIYNWLVGAQMVSKNITSSGTWTIKIVRNNGYAGYIVWNQNGTEIFSVPSSWKINRSRDLDGKTTTTTNLNTITIGTSPVLFETVSDTNSPAFSEIKVINITKNSSDITWETSEATNGQVEYGITSSYGNSSSINTSLLTTHSIKLSSLAANSMYHYRLISRDAAGNLSISNDNVFTTLLDTDKPPTISLTTTLLGNNPAYISQGSIFVDPGVSIGGSDDYLFKIYASVNGKAVGTISDVHLDTRFPTTYTIVYTTTDSTGRSTSGTRTVIVNGTGLPETPSPSLPASITQTVNLTKSLMFGSRNSEVLALQQFFISTGYITPDNATGYFGKITRSAVQKYQCVNGIVCSGSETTSGYGKVGPRTRAKLGGR
jgi:hypothetical protein